MRRGERGGPRGSASSPTMVLAGGILLLLLFAALLILLQVGVLRATALSLAEEEGRFLGRYLGQRYLQPGVFLNEAGEVEIPPELPEEIRSELAALEIVMLKIYDLSGRIVASTDPSYVGMEREDNPSFREALSGRIVGKRADRRYYRDLYGRESAEDLLELYVPIWSPAKNAPAAVFEIYRPWSRYAPLIRKGTFLTAGLAAVITVLLCLLFVFQCRWLRVRLEERERPGAGP